MDDKSQRNDGNEAEIVAKTDDGEDRFDEFGMGVKKKYRPEWLDQENKIFINKLNYLVKNYESDHKTVSLA